MLNSVLLTIRVHYTLNLHQKNTVLLVSPAFGLYICLSVRLSVCLPVCPSEQKRLQSSQLNTTQLLTTVCRCEICTMDDNF